MIALFLYFFVFFFMSSIAQRTSDILFQCTQSHAVLAVAIKNQSEEKILQACVSPHIILCENRVQEAENRKEFLASLPQKKHFIGFLQKNKIRKAIHLFSCIQSVDSLELLYEIERIAIEEKLAPEVFLSINISEDEAKTGFSLDHIPDVLLHIKNNPLTAVRITGLFTIIKNNSSAESTLIYYNAMKRLFDVCTKILGNTLQHLSMGMSSDYQLALSAKSTMVRIGSAIFHD